MWPNWKLPRVFQKLSKRYRVIALDNRGHGKSDKPYDPAQYGLELVDDVVRLMDHLGIAKAHVVGYSLGGFITLKLALRHPEPAVVRRALWRGLDSQSGGRAEGAISACRRTWKKGAALRRF